MDVNEAIRFKRAVREFKNEKLTDDEIRTILKAGRRAQSSKNSQPWHFIAIQEHGKLEQLSKLGTFAGHLAGAALGVAIITPHPDERFSIMFDAGQAAAYMQLAAWELGVGSCLATIYEPDQARQLLGFPEDLHLRIAISFGYPADESQITQAPQGNGRMAFNEIIHWDTW
ncbi:MAG: hypothetical protein DWQ07_00105 [Chloroflexi bacterium]|nr:MAG: hypothetical protein DWQ07_00105 [Chloroflexota bacterium]MBL1196036.1 hypothetical protein [Chloroflexota bacterium]NOH13330.1 nitroreductase family protein [Chloroflexota bacterium]